MVYRKYVSHKGKKYGPYYYDNKRVGKRVVSKYIGDSYFSVIKYNYPRLSSYSLIFFIVFILLLLTLFFLEISTGRATLDIASDVKEGDLLSGTFNLGLESGEFLPADTQVVVSLGDIEKTLALSELVSNAPVSGTYYASGNSLTGTGQGYGAGAETRHPEVSFELLISKGESGSVGGGDTGKTEEKKDSEVKKQESDKGEKKDEKNREESWEESKELKENKKKESG